MEKRESVLGAVKPLVPCSTHGRLGIEEGKQLRSVGEIGIDGGNKSVKNCPSREKKNNASWSKNIGGEGGKK